MRLNHLRTLVLNADYTPISVQPWQKAMILVFKDVVDMVDDYKLDAARDCKGNEYPIPAVVRLRRYVKKDMTSVPFSKKNVFLRDKLMCQYCGQKFHPKDLTFDHVVPRAKWKNQNHKGRTPTQWENIVSCCFPCNQRKNNRTPQEANMPLRNGLPKQPRHGELIVGFNPWREDTPIEWQPYLKSVFKNL
jgi:5-methylcytosine-specific restriction endonuclease McrA